MRIAHLPLDSRPCNALFPGQLAAWCGHECLIPSGSEMDCFTVPASYDASSQFLLRSAAQADALVVSVDHLCYGSLLGSRSDEVAEAEALRRLELLEELHRRYPHLPIYAYSVVMRSSISMLYAGDQEAYQAMTEYSVFSDRAACTGDPQDELRAQQALLRIPEATLRRYQLARRRNHAVNLRCVALAASGTLYALALLQEDSEIYGFHKAEQRVLLNEKERLHASRVWLHNGADEGGALTVMKAIADRYPLPPVSVRYLGWPNGDFVARYEDRPFFENVEDSLSFAGPTLDANAPDVLAVCCPPDGVQTDRENPACLEGYRLQAQAIEQLVRQGKRVYVLDQTRANGGSLSLMRAVHQRLPDLPLAGYSAWNTASNALGTAIAQMMSDMLASQPNRAFLWERLLDDLAYQGVVREELYDAVQSAGDDPFRLNHPQAAQQLLASHMAAFTAAEPLFSAVPSYTASLSWDRLFEAEFRIC